MKKIAFIGVGNMASAIISGITSREDSPISWQNIILFNRHIEKIQNYASLGAMIANSLNEAVEAADCIMLCIKPQSFPEILAEFKNINGIENKLFISIAAGISSDTISQASGGAPVVRAMPNTPMLIGCGVTALCRNKKVSDAEYDFACNIFASAGKIVKITENEMNRIISVTGSSPAYVFMLIKAMYNGAVEQGLIKNESEVDGIDEKKLIDIICDTIIGSAELMKCGRTSPDEQIKKVCSKGGTTEQAVSTLEDFKFYDAVSTAMKQCTARAEELSTINEENK